MIENLREMFRNRIMLLLPVAGLLFSASFSFMNYSIFFAKINMGVVLVLVVYAGFLSPEDALTIIRVLQIISVTVILMIPFLLTFATGKFILRLKKHQSTVNHMTYINAASLTNFLINERCRQQPIPKNEFLESLGITDYQPDAIDDGFVRIDYPTVEVPDELPAYDPNGPSPFKKK